MSPAALKTQSSRDEADIRALVESVDRAHHNEDAATAAYAQDADVVLASGAESRKSAQQSQGGEPCWNRAKHSAVFR
jgi:ketosteroid isomerase-like protein